MKTIKKIPLIFLGLLGALVILELSMQTAGFGISSFQNYKNNKALKAKSQYTVMCIGESTTFNGYPETLQKILDEKYPNKFSIINCGVPGIHLENVLGMLDSNIAKYKPDIAVCMMGINDGFISFYSKPIENNKYQYFKLYKLYRLFKKHIEALLKGQKAYSDNANMSEIKYAYYLYAQKKYSDAEFIVKNIIKTNDSNFEAYNFLALLYYYHLNKKDSAYEIALDIIRTNKKVSALNKQNMYEIAIVYNLDFKKNIEFAKQLAEQLLNIDDISIDAGVYGLIKDIISSEQKAKALKKMAHFKEDIDQYYGILAIESMNEKDFERAEEMRIRYPNIWTYRKYKLILDKLIEHKVKVLCMQYPVRSIDSLKNMLKDESCYSEIEFISNEKNFKDLLKKKKFNEIFTDQFAGDFGHYRQEGSVLIAENVTSALEKITINNK